MGLLVNKCEVCKGTGKVENKKCDNCQNGYKTMKGRPESDLGFVMGKLFGLVVGQDYEKRLAALEEKLNKRGGSRQE